ncbi:MULTISPECIES: hypothetical protein [Micromonospora]|uniref:hypothetical protein n=1 Tax=Micromonospora TaxID=1873 RepID=UPI0005A29448|nr:hypothetical protein [Micromonospora sp. L5]
MSTPQTPAPFSTSEVERALATARMHQDSIQHADAKIARLAGLYGALASLIASSLPTRSGIAANPGLGLALGLLCAVFLCCSAVGTRHLALGFRPVVTGPTEANRFGFTEPRSAPLATDAGQETTEAWQLVMLLGQIARDKHRRVRSALPWTLATIASATAWLILASFV